MGCCESKSGKYLPGSDQNSDIVITDIVIYHKTLEHASKWVQENNDQNLSDDVNGNIPKNYLNSESSSLSDEEIQQIEEDLVDVDLKDQIETKLESAKLEINDFNTNETTSSERTTNETTATSNETTATTNELMTKEPTSTSSEQDMSHPESDEPDVTLPPPRPPQKLRKDLVPDVKAFSRVDKMADDLPHMKHETVEELALHLTED